MEYLDLVFFLGQVVFSLFLWRKSREIEEKASVMEWVASVNREDTAQLRVWEMEHIKMSRHWVNGYNFSSE